MPSPAVGVGPKPKPGAGSSTKTASGHAKILGVDWRIAGAGLVLAIVVGLYLRNKIGGSASAGTSASAPADTAGTGGGGATASPDTSSSDLADALNGLTAVLGGGGFAVGDASGNFPIPSDPSKIAFFPGGEPAPVSGASGPNPSYVAAAQVASTTGAGVYVNPDTGGVLVGQDAKGAAAAPGYVNVSQPIPVATENFAHAAVQRSAALNAVGVTAPFGGVKSTTTNKKTGVTTTTYGSGRVVQQAPGKSAYVVKKGG